MAALLARSVSKDEADQLGLDREAWIAGHPETQGTTRIAIVGSREAHPIAEAYARRLAGELASCGAIIVSGGAVGIDGAAHVGALEAGGATWVVLPCGPPLVVPEGHEDLYARVARSSAGAIIWPFARETQPLRYRFLQRNRVLVGLSHAVVVVQAGVRSGALNAAGHAQSLGIPLWVVACAPFVDRTYEGCEKLLREGARRLVRTRQIFEGLPFVDPSRLTDAPATSEPAGEPSFRSGSPEALIWSRLSEVPKHQEFLASEVGVLPFATQAALLTLTLENVVVEGPPGFFRRVTPTSRGPRSHR